jgi:uncharacterized protein (TIGR00369 family)
MSPGVFDKSAIFPILDRGFRERVPHNAALGIRIVDFEPGVCLLELPWAPHLVGNPETGVLHGGPITSLLDACCGAAVFLAMPAPQPIATLDLRIDYLRPATPHRSVIARAQCYKLGRSVAFVRAVAYHDEGSEIAAAAATFMLSTKGKAVVAQTRVGGGS